MGLGTLAQRDPPRRGPRPPTGRKAASGSRSRGRRHSPDANARLTGMTAALLLVLLAAEGVTVLQVHRLLTPHVLIGMVLVPVVVLKTGANVVALRPLLPR